MKSIDDYTELPDFIKPSLTKDDFLYAVEDDDTIVVWQKHPEYNRQLEIEYAISNARPLTIEQRLLNLPADSELIFDEQDVKVILRHQLEDETNAHTEHYEIIALESNALIANQSECRYSPVKIGLKQRIADALESYRLPQKYLRFSQSEKIDYWVAYLYRARRWAGEGGSEPDSVFDASLTDHMLSLDRHIEEILHPVLKRLAEIEMVGFYKLKATFEENTGWPVVQPEPPWLRTIKLLFK